MKDCSIRGVKFDNVTLASATDIAMSMINVGKKSYVVTPNSEIAYMCKDDEKLKNIVNEADLTIPDGIGVVYAAKILKQPITEKVAGVDFAAELVAKMARNGKSLYIIGSKPGVAELACKNLAEKNPGLIIKGYRDGYFKTEDEAIESINSVGGVDAVFVCLGAPKQEFFIYNNKDKINATLFCGLGGSCDVFAGVAERAPDIYIKLGLEWFYRLIKEPKRIGRMAKLPLFMLDTLQYKLFKGNGKD